MSGPWERFKPQSAESKPWERFKPRPTGLGIGNAIQAGIDVGNTVAEEAQRTGVKARPRNVDPVEAQRDKVRDAEIKDLQTDDGFFDRANDFLLRGRYSFEAGADRIIGSAQQGLGFKQAGEDTLRAARRKQEVADTTIPNATSWDDVKANPLNAPKFIAETGLESLPGMAVAALGPAGATIFAGSQTGNIGQQRAENNGRTDATAGDFLKAAPAAIGSALLERTGITGIIGSTGKNAGVRIGKAAAAEGVTEFGQSALEYTGATLGTDKGYRLDEMLDQSFAGAVGGVGVGGAIRGIVEGASAPFRRPIAEGKREKASKSATVQQTDVDSPLPTEAIIAGRDAISNAMGMQEADGILQAAGMPATGKRVAVTMPDGTVKTGIVEDAFDEDVEGERANGVKIRFDDGSALREHFDTLADAGVSVALIGPGTAADIDAELAARAAQNVPAAGTAPDPVAVASQPQSPKGSGVPVDNAKAITEELFPGVRVTSWARDADDPLTKKNPGSWHAKSRAAVDVAPIAGMSFDQFVQRYKDAGFTILEALDETGKGRSKHATGDHWHIVLGQRGGTDATPSANSDQAVPAGDIFGGEPDAPMRGINEGAPDPEVSQYLDAYLDGRGRDDPEMEQFSANNADIIEAEFQRRAATAQSNGQASSRLNDVVEPTAGAAIAARAEERTEIVATATDREVNVRYAVVEAADLRPSNLPDGRVNPEYPADRQPRDRTRAASVNQVQNIAGNLKPYRLGRSVRPDDGAPIIAPNGVVESGNGRTIAVQRVYEQGGDKADSYRRFVESQGIDTAGMRQPVLVRIREDVLTPDEERAFAREANMPTALGMAPTEQAMADADALSSNLLALYQGGDVDSAANSGFVRAFMQQVMSPMEAAQMQRANGTPNKSAYVRIRNALLGQAYSNPLLVENVSESLDSNIVAIGGALTDVAGPWAQMIDATMQGNIPASLNITQNLNEAVDVIDKARREGIKVADIINQRSIFTGDTVDPITEALLRLFFLRPDFTKPSGRARIRIALESYVKQAMKQRLDQGTLGQIEPTDNPSGLLGTARVSQGYANDAEATENADTARKPAASVSERAQPNGGDFKRSGGESLPPVSKQKTQEPAGDSKPEIADSEAAAKFDPDKQDILAVVDANNQIKNVRKSAAEREAFRQGAANALGVEAKSAFTYDAKNALQRLAFENGRKAAGAELKARNRRTEASAKDGDTASPQADIEAAVAEIDTDPTDAQKEALDPEPIAQPPAQPEEVPAAETEATAEPDTATEPAPEEKPRGEALYDERGQQIGYYDPETGTVTRSDKPVTEPDSVDAPVLLSVADETPVATLTGEEMGKLPKNKDLRIKIMRDRAINWYRSKLQGTTVVGADGVEVRFSRSGMKKSTAGKGRDLLRAVPAIRAIIENGKVVRMPDRDGTRAFFYSAPVELDGVVQKMGVVALEDADGRRQYDLTKDTGKRSIGSTPNGAGAFESVPGIEASSDAEFNLFIVDEEINNNNNMSGDTKKQAALGDLQARMQELGIQEKIALRVVDRLGARTAGTFNARWTMDDEKFIRGTISIALEAPQASDFTLNHEAIHAMRSLGLFRDAEWAALSRRAQSDFALMRSIKRRYAGLSPEAQVEEAIADMFARWKRLRNQKGLAAKAFDRILAFMTALSAWAKGRGWTSAEDVMRAIDSGKQAGREDVERFASNAQNSEIVKEANYETAPDGLMGFAKDPSRQKPFGANRYPIEQDIRIDLDGDVFEDTIEGLNKSHAIERAKRNWPGADIEAIGEPRKIAKASLFDEPEQPKKTMTDKQRAELEARQKQGMARKGGQQGLGDQEGGLFSSERDQGTLFSITDEDTAMPSGFERNKAGNNLFELHFGAVNDMLDSIGDGKSKSVDKVSKAWDEFRIKVQDRFLPLLRLQQAVERDLGKPLAETSNPYMGEELMSGKIGAKLEALNDDHVQPLYDALVESDVSLDELETYLYARHAPERNKRISQINPQFEQGSGSGMTDIEAAAIMNRIENSGKMDAIKGLASRVDAMLEESVKARVDAGLMSEQDAATWRQHYKYYVPLRGRAEVEGGTLEPVRSNSGQSGISVKGKESRRAFGRRSKADSILAYSILQAQESIARSEKNRVARQFYELAKQAPDPNFWQIDKIERRPVFNKAKGQVEYQSQSRISAEDAPYTVSVKIEGVEHRVTMNRDNPAAVKLATAMRNLTAQKLGWLVNVAGSINRFFSAANTSYNPEFIIVNAFRDVQAASINLGQVEQAGMVQGVLKDYRKALAASIRGGFGSSKGEWGQWYREFVTQGGRTFFNQFDDLDQVKDRIERQMKLASDRAMGRISVRRGFEEVLNFVEKANNSVENAIRLSVYKNAREAGLSKAQAASLAKNITVNFNRRGEWGAGINAMYLFFNASVQGTATIFNAAKSKRVQKIMGGIVIAGAVLEMLNAALSDDDEDGESYYDKIPDFDKSRNLIIMLPGQDGKFIKIPMPYGYNAVFGLGRGLAEIGRRGGDRWKESLATIAQTSVDAFNPIGGTQSLLNFISPTIVDPIVDLYRNRDFADRPIMPEQSSFEVPDPDAQRYFGSVAPHWKAVTDFLTSATGGDEVQAGAVDVSPETLEYLQGVFLGAAGQFFDRNLGLVLKWDSDDPYDEISANDFSFYRKFVGDVPPWRDKSVFYERVRAVEEVIDDAKDYAEREDWQSFDKFVDENIKLASLETAVKESRKEMRAIRKARGANELQYDLGKIDETTYNEERTIYKQAEDLVVAEFNSQWVATMKVVDAEE